MNKFIYDSWIVVMNSEHVPLRSIPDTNTRHLVMQLLAWMWCIIFSMYIGSITVFFLFVKDIKQILEKFTKGQK